MTTAPPQQINGHPRPEQRDAVTEPPTMYDPVAEAEAEAIRARTYAENEALRETARIEAEAKGKAIETKAAAEAERMRISNERAEMKLHKERVDHAAYVAKKDREREVEERAAREAREADEAARAEQASEAESVEQADAKWRKYAIWFAVVCAIVSLPVQMTFFFSKTAPWMAAVPLMLEGGAWVVQRGAAAAVANRRPLWHYRSIAWLLAFVAAGINLYHGLHAFDLGTALATAFASLAGPGVWDLHEHGRIRRRDGVLPRSERKAQEKAAKAADAEKAAREAEQKKAKDAADKAAAEAAQKLAADRQENFPKVWEHALKLAAALGETTVTEAIWRRAHRDVEGADPAESADILNMRKNAERRVEAARSGAPVSKVSKAANAQRASQMPPASKQRVYAPPARSGKRRPGDTPRYVNAARKAASVTAKQAVSDTRKEDSK